MHAMFIGAALALTGALDVWLESSLTNVYPGTPPRSTGGIYTVCAARGERESLQVCLRSDDPRVCTLEASPLKPKTALTKGLFRRGGTGRGELPGPFFRLVGYLEMGEASPRACPPEGISVKAGEAWLQPDPLLEYAPVQLEASQTRAVWVSFDIPVDAPPGHYECMVNVKEDGRTRAALPVTVEIYGLEIPAEASLRVLGPLNREAIRACYGMDDRDLEAWRPVYDAFAGNRVSLSIWEDGGLVRWPEGIQAGASAIDTTILRAHLEYAVPRLRMNTINLADASYGIAPFTAPEEPLAQDPLQNYLIEMGQWLQERGWINRGVILPWSVPAREDWIAARDTFFRVFRADKRMKRLMLGEPHPYFERYTDIWAMPLRTWHPTIAGRLSEGMSLAAAVPYPVASIRTSEPSPLTTQSLYCTASQDACDGCLYTAWCSADVARAQNPPTLEIQFTEPVKTRELKIGWVPGFEASEMKVFTSVDGAVFGDSACKWELKVAPAQFEQSWSGGEFSTTKTFKAIRFEFTKSRHSEERPVRGAGRVAVTELEFGTPPDPATIAKITPVEMWLCPLQGDFPSLSADAHPVEARMMGWVCWAHGYRGFTLEALNNWPMEWTELAASQPVLWPAGAGAGEGWLMYPGKTAPMGSIRMERLRDGLEDYEYFAALDAAIKSRRVSRDEAAPVLRTGLFAYDLPPAPDVLGNLAGTIAGRRADVARLLGGGS